MTKRERPILTRHNAASLNEFLHYTSVIPMRSLCRILQRCERTIKGWMKGTAVIPPWAVATLRLKHLEHELMKDQMGLNELSRQQRTENAHPIPRRPAANEGDFATQLTLDIA